MLYESLYSGQKIDELLEAIQFIKKVDNGWVKMESSEDNPVDFDTLINPGNYSFEYWDNAPNGIEYMPPVNVMVSKEGNKIHQYIFSLGLNKNVYSRTYDLDTGKFDEWVDENITPGVNVSPNEPENPSANDIWINTSNKDAIIQYFDEVTNSWKSLNPKDYMDPYIYNSSNIDFTEGIYKYIDESTKNISGSESPIDFTDHINDENIHLTKDEKDDLNSRITRDELTSTLNTLYNELYRNIDEKIKQTGFSSSKYEIILNSIKESVDAHISNNTEHPSTEQINSWNNKAEADHTHDFSSIQISVDDIVGEYTIDMLPDSVKERMTVLNTISEVNELTIEDIQNGDWVFTRDERILYQVVDETKLGLDPIDNTKALVVLNTPPREVTWDEIQNKPQSPEDLGINLPPSKDEIDSLLDDLDKCKEDVEDGISKIEGTISNLDYANSMETLIDIIDHKMKFINDYALNQ